MYVRADSIAGHGLTAEQMIDAAALSMHDLAVLQALLMVHGDAGLRRYFELGGAMRFDGRAEAWVPVRGRPPAVNQGRCPGPGGCFPHEGCPYRTDDCAAR